MLQYTANVTLRRSCRPGRPSPSRHKWSSSAAEGLVPGRARPRARPRPFPLPSPVQGAALYTNTHQHTALRVVDTTFHTHSVSHRVFTLRAQRPRDPSQYRRAEVASCRHRERSLSKQNRSLSSSYLGSGQRPLRIRISSTVRARVWSRGLLGRRGCSALGEGGGAQQVPELLLCVDLDLVSARPDAEDAVGDEEVDAAPRVAVTVRVTVRVTGRVGLRVTCSWEDE